MVLQGKAVILKDISFTQKLSPEEYYNYVKEIMANKDFILLKRTLNQNKLIFPLEINDIEKMPEIIFKIALNSLVQQQPTISELENFFISRGKSLNEYGLQELISDSYRLDNPNTKKENYFNILNTIKIAINIKELIIYNYFESYEKKVLKCFRSQKVGEIEANQYFGDLFLDSFTSVR